MHKNEFLWLNTAFKEDLSAYPISIGMGYIFSDTYIIKKYMIVLYLLYKM